MRRTIPRGSLQHLIRMVHLQILCRLQRESPLPLSEACFGYIDADFRQSHGNRQGNLGIKQLGKAVCSHLGPLKAARVVEASKYHTSALSGQCCQWPAGEDENSFMASWVQVLEMP